MYVEAIQSEMFLYLISLSLLVIFVVELFKKEYNLSAHNWTF